MGAKPELETALSKLLQIARKASRPNDWSWVDEFRQELDSGTFAMLAGNEKGRPASRPNSKLNFHCNSEFADSPAAGAYQEQFDVMQGTFDELEASGEIMRTGETRNGKPVYVATKHVGRA